MQVVRRVSESGTAVSTLGVGFDRIGDFFMHSNGGS